MEWCYLCNENETGRLIEGIPVCDTCFVQGGLNIEENMQSLKEAFESEYIVPQKESKPKAIKKAGK